MANEGSLSNISTPSPSEHYLDLWYAEGNEIIEAGGPSSVEVQPDLTDSPRSISQSSHLEDFESASPSDRLADNRVAEDLDIMGIANTWNDDDAFAADSAAPSKAGELSCLGLGQSAGTGPWPSPTPLELFEDERDSFCEFLGDVSDSNGAPGVCGLRNMGNTCFMNAGLQCLVNTRPLVDFFLSRPLDERLSSCGSLHLTAQFCSILVKMWSGNLSTLRPTEFKHTLSLYHPQFKDYRQHDCQEFLALLLDSLHEQLSAMTLKSSGSGGGGVGGGGAADDAAACSGGSPDANQLATECRPLSGEAMEMYESSRSSQLSSPRSSDSVETSSSCTTSSSVSTARGKALSLRSLPIPEQVKQSLLFPLITTADGAPLLQLPQTSITDHLAAIHGEAAYGSSAGANVGANARLVMERNLLNRADSSSSSSAGVLEKNLLTEISSMMKDSKTANVNISSGAGVGAPANNEICFDSVKFGDLTKVRPGSAAGAGSCTIVRNMVPGVQAEQGAKNELKMTNVLKEAAKRLSKDHMELDTCPGDQVSSGTDDHSNVTSANNEARTSKRPRIDCGGATAGHDDQGDQLLASLVALATEEDPVKQQQQQGGDARCKESVVTDTFQGRFRSTVVCCTCKHVSVTYEPFMYLSVPLPRALERVVDVVFVPAWNEGAPTRHQIVVQQYDKVSKMRQLLVKVLQLDDQQASQLILCEVVNHHIGRILDDQLVVRYLKDGQRTVYALIVPPAAASLTPPTAPPPPPQDSASSTTTSSAGHKVDDDGDAHKQAWKSCMICLEEMADENLRKHTCCSCLLCQSCIEAACRHCGGDGQSLVCPVCQVQVKHDQEFAPLDKLHHYRPVIRLLNIPILFRVASQANRDGSSSSAKTASPAARLTGHPRMLQLPSIVSCTGLYDIVQHLLPKPVPFDLCFVDNQGMRCQRCVYPARCNGCQISRDEDRVSLQPGDCLIVQASWADEDQQTSSNMADWDDMFDDGKIVDHNATACSYRNEPLTLDDCLKAFSESETLDEGNPWFCPKCQKSQCASKTLNICQAPPYLIVYLKRFVFHDNTSSKLDNRVNFPLTGLSLQPYVDCTDFSSVDADDGCGQLNYDLYGVVCHFGSASSGHYTAYTKHATTGQWHYFNDETVLTRKPQEEDFSHGYVLLYQRSSSASSDSIDYDK